MIRSELNSAIIAITGRSDKSSLVNSAINRGLSRLAHIHRFTTLRKEKLVPFGEDDFYVNLPSDFLELYTITFLDGTMSYQMDVKDAEFVEKSWPDPSSDPTGKPTHGYVSANAFYFRPRSNGSYEFKFVYYGEPEKLTTDSSENPIPGSDNAIIAFGAAYVLKAVQLYSQAGHWENEWREEALSLIQSDRRRQGTKWRKQLHGCSNDPLHYNQNVWNVGVDLR